MNRATPLPIQFRLRPLTQALTAGVFAGSMLSGASLAAEPDNADASGEPNGALASVVVVGTNRANQQQLDGLAPVDVISAQQLRDSGALTLSEALVRLNPSVNFPQDTTGPQAATNGKSIALHGLAPDQTLVLVNGKRLVAQSTLTAGNPPMFGYMGHPIDINIIPLAAIERVEILRDGASAQYGADAVAGVVNIVLRERSSGGNAALQLGQFTAKDKPHGAPDQPSGSLRLWKGLPLGDDGFVTLAAEVEHVFHPEEGVASPNPVYAPAGPAAQGTLPAYDPWRHLMGYGGPTKASKVLANAEVAIDASLRAYGTVSFAHARKLGSSLTVPMYDAKAIIGLFPEGRDDFTEVLNDAWTAAAGLRWKSANLGDFDLGVNYGKNRSRSRSLLAYNQSLGLASPVGLDMSVTATSLAGLSLDWGRTADWGLVEPVSLSAGAAVRQDRYDAGAGEWASWYVAPGAVIGPGHYRWNAATKAFTALNPNTPVLGPGGISPAEAGTWTRQVRSLYADVEGRLAPALSFGVAARAEDYTDFGRATSGKLSLRYDVSPALAVRATLSNGLRAPSLIQSNYTSRQSSVAQGTLLVPSLALPVNDPLAVALGARALKPETSRNAVAGLVWRPAQATSVTLDLYRIGVDDKIAYSETLQDTGSGKFNAYLVGKGFQSGSIVRFFVNGMDTVTRGADLQGHTAVKDGWLGNWEFDAGYTSNRTRVTRTSATPEAVAATGQTLVGVVTKLMVTDATPSYKLQLSQKLASGPWTVQLSEKRYGRYQEALTAAVPTPQSFAPQNVVDLDIGYKLSKALQLHVGARNLFNSFPDTEWASNRRVGQTNYPNLAPEGFDGRFLYASLSYSL